MNNRDDVDRAASQISRRTALKRTGAMAAAAWAAPAIATFAPSAGAGSPPPGGGNPSCFGFNGDLSGWTWSGFPSSSGFTGYSSGDTPYQGSGSLSFHGLNTGGDTGSPNLAAVPMLLSVAYRTRGGAGYFGVNEYDAGGNWINEQWLLGDGTYPAGGYWDYNFFTQDASKLNIWKVYNTVYNPSAGAATFRIKAEHFGNAQGFGNDPVNQPVFFDQVCYSPVAG
jgi:hypothetical protein